MDKAERETRTGMSEETAPSPAVREAVASFPDREHFHRAVRALLAAGFVPSDLSVLATHDALATAGEPVGEKPGILPVGLTDEIRFIEPLTAAGIILWSAGPIAAVIAGLIGAGLGAAALKELFDSTTAPRHREDFRAALDAGAVLLWVRCEDAQQEAKAKRILARAGGRNRHVHTRPPHPGEAAPASPRRSTGKGAG
jgi:hypothetical protein